MRILVVEDDLSLAANLHTLLEAEGFAVDTAHNGVDGLHAGLEYAIDLAVIDLGLPDLGGVELIAELRAAAKTYPILILTARDGWQDKVAGLEAGADDYLTKPFHNAELVARVNALLRRSKGFAKPVIELGALSLDTAAKTIHVNSELLATTAYEYRLLECLMLNLGVLMSKAELAEHIYAEDAEQDSNVIEVFVGRLRKKLAAQGLTDVIETVRGQGYRVAVKPVDVAQESSGSD